MVLKDPMRREERLEAAAQGTYYLLSKCTCQPDIRRPALVKQLISD